jgi:hypothetical protein
MGVDKCAIYLLVINIFGVGVFSGGYIFFNCTVYKREEDLKTTGIKQPSPIVLILISTKSREGANSLQLYL